MAKIKLVVSATIEETFSDFIISKKTKGLAEKTLQSYQSQFQAVARHMDVKMDIAMLQKAENIANVYYVDNLSEDMMIMDDAELIEYENKVLVWTRQ